MWMTKIITKLIEKHQYKMKIKTKVLIGNKDKNKQNWCSKLKTQILKIDILMFLDLNIDMLLYNFLKNYHFINNGIRVIISGKYLVYQCHNINMVALLSKIYLTVNNRKNIKEYHIRAEAWFIMSFKSKKNNTDIPIIFHLKMQMHSQS